MSQSPSERTSLHHLTQDGWINDRPAPGDAVETWRRVYEPASEHWPRPRITYMLAWASPAHLAEDRRALHERFERPETGVSARVADVAWEIPE